MFDKLTKQEIADFETAIAAKSFPNTVKFKEYFLFKLAENDDFNRVTELLEDPDIGINCKHNIILEALKSQEQTRLMRDFRNAYHTAAPRPFKRIIAANISDVNISDAMIIKLLESMDLSSTWPIDTTMNYITHAIEYNNTVIYQYLINNDPKSLTKNHVNHAAVSSNMYFLNHMLEAKPKLVKASDAVSIAAKLDNKPAIELLLEKTTFTAEQKEAFAGNVGVELMLQYIDDARFTAVLTETDNIDHAICKINPQKITPLSRRNTIKILTQLISHPLISKKIKSFDQFNATMIFVSLADYGSIDLLNLYLSYRPVVNVEVMGKKLLYHIVFICIKHHSNIPELLDLCIKAIKLTDKLGSIDTADYKEELDKLDPAAAIGIHKVLCKYDTFRNSDAARGFEKVNNKNTRLRIS